MLEMDTILFINQSSSLFTLYEPNPLGLRPLGSPTDIKYSQKDRAIVLKIKDIERIVFNDKTIELEPFVDEMKISW